MRNILKQLFKSINSKEKCKNKKCENKRRHCSSYCEECSKSYGDKTKMD